MGPDTCEVLTDKNVHKIPQWSTSSAKFCVKVQQAIPICLDYKKTTAKVFLATLHSMNALLK